MRVMLGIRKIKRSFNHVLKLKASYKSVSIMGFLFQLQITKVNLGSQKKKRWCNEITIGKYKI